VAVSGLVGLENLSPRFFGSVAAKRNGPDGKVIKVRRPPGQGSMTILPLEQQAFGHGFSDASPRARSSDQSSDRTLDNVFVWWLDSVNREVSAFGDFGLTGSEASGVSFGIRC
jgi:hypothetical protein